MSESIQHEFGQMKNAATKINKRLERIEEIYDEVFEDHYARCSVNGENGSPIGPWRDGEFYVDVEYDTVNGVPIALLDRSDDDIRNMWIVLKYDASIKMIVEIVKNSERSIASYTSKPDADLQNDLFLEVKKNTAKRKEYLKEATADRAKIMDSFEDADAISKHLGFIR